MHSYARAIGSQTKIPSFTQDIATNAAEKLSDATVSPYIDVFKKLFVLEDCPAWNPNLRSRVAIRTSETRYYTDPSIGIVALGAGPKDLINDLHSMGLFFENLCLRDLRIYADCLDGQIYHYRDRSGLECDAVIHLRNGQYGLIEIKLGGDKAIEEGVSTLNSLATNIDILKMPPPAFKMILVGLSTYAYKRK